MLEKGLRICAEIGGNRIEGEIERRGCFGGPRWKFVQNKRMEKLDFGWGWAIF